MKSILKVVIFFVFALTVFYLFFPFEFVMPVKGATRTSYNQQSFWAYPWGSSGHHKGVDIFHKKGTPVLSATKGIVVFKGVISKGGKAILILGPRLRLHYYAHLDTMLTSYFGLVNAGEQIGTVGASGNAKGKPPHLHYSISRVVPRIKGTEDWIKRFYDDPIPLLNEAVARKR